MKLLTISVRLPLVSFNPATSVNVKSENLSKWMFGRNVSDIDEECPILKIFLGSLQSITFFFLIVYLPPGLPTFYSICVTYMD